MQLENLLVFNSFSSSSFSELDSFFLVSDSCHSSIPLTMSAGLLFGTFIGTIIVSLSGTVSCFGVNCFL